MKFNEDKLDIDKLKNVSSNLSNLKSKVVKLDFDKLVPVPVGLCKQSDVVKNYVVENDVYHARIKNIEDKIPDCSNLATNTTINGKIYEVKSEVPNITNLATNVPLNAKIFEIKGKIPNTTHLVITIALTAVGKEILDVSNLVKKLTITQKLVKLKVKLLLIMIMINILVLKNFIN